MKWDRWTTNEGVAWLCNRAQKSSKVGEQKADTTRSNGKLWAFTQFADLSQFSGPELIDWKGGQVPLKNYSVVPPFKYVQ